MLPPDSSKFPGAPILTCFDFVEQRVAEIIDTSTTADAAEDRVAHGLRFEAYRCFGIHGKGTYERFARACPVMGLEAALVRPASADHRLLSF